MGEGGRLIAWLLMGACRHAEPVGVVAMGPSSSSATIASGWAISGVDGRVLGPEARLGDASFEVTNLGGAPARLGVSRVEVLAGHRCDAAPEELSAVPAVHGLSVALPPTEPVIVADTGPTMVIRGGARTEIAPAADVQPGPTSAHVYFDRVDLSAGPCARYAVRVTFDASGTPIVAVAEQWVTAP